MIPFILILKPWELCDIKLGKNKIKFMRRENNFQKISEEMLPWLSGHEIIIAYNDTLDYWWAGNLSYGYDNPINPLYGFSKLDKTGNTPETIMFKVDLFLLDNERYNVEEPFIFPMNDL